MGHKGTTASLRPWVAAAGCWQQAAVKQQQLQQQLTFHPVLLSVQASVERSHEARLSGRCKERTSMQRRCLPKLAFPLANSGAVARCHISCCSRCCCELLRRALDGHVWEAQCNGDDASVATLSLPRAHCEAARDTRVRKRRILLELLEQRSGVKWQHHNTLRCPRRRQRWLAQGGAPHA